MARDEFQDMTSFELQTEIVRELRGIRLDLENLLKVCEEQNTLLQSINQKIGGMQPGPTVAIKIVPGTPS